MVRVHVSECTTNALTMKVLLSMFCERLMFFTEASSEDVKGKQCLFYFRIDYSNHCTPKKLNILKLMNDF